MHFFFNFGLFPSCTDNQVLYIKCTNFKFLSWAEIQNCKSSLIYHTISLIPQKIINFLYSCGHILWWLWLPTYYIYYVFVIYHTKFCILSEYFFKKFIFFSLKMIIWMTTDLLYYLFLWEIWLFVLSLHVLVAHIWIRNTYIQLHIDTKGPIIYFFLMADLY